MFKLFTIDSFLLALCTFNDLFVILCQIAQPNRAKLGMDDMERQL